MYCLTGICALSYVVSRLIVRNFTIPRKITGSGFFIYAFHGLYVTLCVKAVLLVIKPDSSLGYVGCYVANFFCHVYAVYLRVLRPEEVSSRGFVGHVRREDRLTFQIGFWARYFVSYSELQYTENWIKNIVLSLLPASGN